jgi:hypothetical protein
MTQVAAPSALVFRRRRTMELLTLHPELEIGAGGEARVYALDGDDTLVAKVYHHPTMERARKLALMMMDPPQLDPDVATLAWPCDLLLDRRGRFVGFLMPRAEGPRVFEFYNPVTRRQTAPLCHYGVLHRAGANLAAAFDALHERGYVVGDVNESNVLIGERGIVTLVDADSLQVRDPEDGAVHRSHVGKPEFTPPELQGKAFADFDRAPEHDRFGLAVLLFLLLMEGTHPFAGRLRGGGETPPMEERIQRGLFPHHGHEEFLPPRMAPRFGLLHPALRALFVRAFVDGHDDPSARPTAAEWREALAAAQAQLAVCEHNPLHRHGAHLDACPWCERTSLLKGRDPFPAHLVPAGFSEDGEDGARAVSIFGGPRAVARRGGALPAAAAAMAVGNGTPIAAVVARQGGDLMGAFGTPVPWLAPLLCLAVFGGVPFLQTVAFFGFVYALMRALQRGLAGATAAEVVTASLFLFALAAILAAIGGTPGGGYADDPAYPDVYPVASPGTTTDAFDVAGDSVLVPAEVVAQDGAVRAWFGNLYTQDTVDVGPELLDPGTAQALLASSYPARLAERGVEGSVTLRLLVREDGTVDPDFVIASDARPYEITWAFSDAAKIRFVPLTRGGEPTTAWVSLEMRFTRRDESPY